MDLAGLRDLVIIICGLTSLLILIMAAIIMNTIYQRLKHILGHVDAVSANIEQISEMARDAAVSLIPFEVLIQAIFKVFESMKGLLKK